MKFLTTFLLLPALAVCAAVTSQTAAASPPPKANSAGYSWNVTGWSAGCARAGCYYDFNVTGPQVKDPKAHKTSLAGLDPPSFKAYCSGEQDFFRPCKLLRSSCDGKKNSACGVSARLFKDPNDPTNATIGISYQWTHYQDAQNSPRWNLTGFNQSIFNQFAAPLQTFLVTPSEAYGVD